MKLRLWGVLIAPILLIGAGAKPLSMRPASAVKREEPTFQKIVLDREFRSEGCAVADVNHDGKPDILVGEIWYEAPNWKPHHIAEPGKYEPAHGYSNSFFVFTADVNHDGWMDEIVIGFPGAKTVWRENPKNKEGFWKEHLISDNSCNESAAFIDLIGRKNPVFVMGDDKTLGWIEPKKGANGEEWERHVVSAPNQPGSQRFSHGLGVGDINGDGHKDILCNGGYWLAPKDPRTSPWQFVPANFSAACAQMYVADVNGDGLPDVICSSAHNKGVWWFEQRRTATGTEFIQHTIDDSFSQSHGMAMADMNGDGQMDFVTGKRFWAHGPEGDVDANLPAFLYWYEYKRVNGKVEWVRHLIDTDSGVGTQVTTADVNKDGKMDVVVSNKKGVFVFLQE